VQRAEAPRPAAVRLAQRTRLAELEAEIDEGKPALEAAQGALRAATEAFRAAEEGVKTARAAPFPLDKAVTAARDRVEALGREQARKEARAQALDETLARLTTEVEAARAALTETQGVEAPSETLEALRAELTATRTAADAARGAAATARVERDAEAREVAGRQARLDGLTRERYNWAGRAKDSRVRIAALEKDAEKTTARLKAAAEAPERLATQRSSLLDALTTAETRRKRPLRRGKRGRGWRRGPRRRPRNWPRPRPMSAKPRRCRRRSWARS
jgi:chromosome segregation protein